MTKFWPSTAKSASEQFFVDLLWIVAESLVAKSKQNKKKKLEPQPPKTFSSKVRMPRKVNKNHTPEHIFHISPFSAADGGVRFAAFRDHARMPSATASESMFALGFSCNKHGVIGACS